MTPFLLKTHCWDKFKQQKIENFLLAKISLREKLLQCVKQGLLKTRCSLSVAYFHVYGKKTTLEDVEANFEFPA